MGWWRWDEPSNQHSAISQTFFTATDAKDAKDEIQIMERRGSLRGSASRLSMYLTITTDLIQADLANRAPNSFAPLASFAVDASIFGLNAER